MLFGEFGPEERDALRRRLAEDADFRASFLRWHQLLRHVGQSIEDDLPDERLLVLEAFRRTDPSEFLLSEDATRLNGAEDVLDSALAAHPGLGDVVRHLQEDANAFDEVWNSELEAPSVRPSRRPTRVQDRASRSPGRRGIGRWVWRASAAAAVVTFALVVTFLMQRTSDLESVTTGPDQTREIQLADGSQVRLLPNSTLEYHAEAGAGGTDRFVRLQGDGYFDVAPDRSGFTIELPTAVVVVLGTSFGVQASDEEARVYLTTGRLSVASHAARSTPVVLRPGQMTAVGRDSLPETPVETDMSRALSWTGLLIFRDTPVRAVAEVLAESFGVDITVDPRLRDETLTATFNRTDGLSTVLEAVAAALDASVIMQNDTHHLVPR